MISPTVLNTDTDLNGKTLLVAETLASISGGLVPASDGVQVGYLLRKTISLTNAQIKAASTSYITVVDAPGAGYFLRFHSAYVYIDASAGAYTNVNSTDAMSGMTIAYGDWDFDASTLFYHVGLNGSATKFIGFIEPYTLIPSAAVLVSEYPPYTSLYGFSSIQNLPLKLVDWNNGAGNWTGGNNSNTGKVVVYYTKEPIP